jgi:signal peptidase II
LGEHILFWSVTAAGLVLDLWSKSAVFAWLSERGGSFPVINGYLQLVLAQNPGAAFGIATGQRYPLIVVSLLALILIVILFLVRGAHHKLTCFALGLFAAGVSGNLYDRIFNDGLVRDFIDVVYWPGKHWPAFNIADSMLCIAVGLMIISTYAAPKHSR